MKIWKLQKSKLFYAEKQHFLWSKVVLMRICKAPCSPTRHYHYCTHILVAGQYQDDLCVLYMCIRVLIQPYWLKVYHDNTGLFKDQLVFFLLKSNIINSAWLINLLNVNAMYLFKSFVTKPLTLHECLKLKWLLVTKFKHLIAKIIFKHYAY